MTGAVKSVTIRGCSGGAAIQLSTCNGTGAQWWNHAVNTSTWAPASASTPPAPGTLLQIWDCTGDADQQWTVH